MDIKNLPLDVKFIYMAMTQSAIYMKKLKYDKESFINFASEIWESMNLNNIDDLESTLKNVMEKDVESYLKNRTS